MPGKVFCHRGMDVRITSHARARRVTLRVKPPGVVHLVAPVGLKRVDIPAILERHREWLLKGLEAVREQQAVLEAAAPPSQVSLQASGESWNVRYVQSTGTRRIRTHNRERELLIGLDAHGEWREPLRRWLMSQARRQLGARLEALAEDFGFSYRRLSIRGQKTRWGSCSASGTISLNYRLLFLPPAWVRYLLIHELCHTREMNHSAAFWALVERCEPDYRHYDKALRRAAEHLPAWLLGL